MEYFKILLIQCIVLWLNFEFSEERAAYVPRVPTPYVPTPHVPPTGNPPQAHPMTRATTGAYGINGSQAPNRIYRATSEFQESRTNTSRHVPAYDRPPQKPRTKVRKESQASGPINASVLIPETTIPRTRVTPRTASDGSTYPIERVLTVPTTRPRRNNNVNTSEQQDVKISIYAQPKTKNAAEPIGPELWAKSKQLSECPSEVQHAIRLAKTYMEAHGRPILQEQIHKCVVDQEVQLKPLVIYRYRYWYAKSTLRGYSQEITTYFTKRGNEIKDRPIDFGEFHDVDTEKDRKYAHLFNIAEEAKWI